MTPTEALARAIHAHNHYGTYEACPERLRHEEQASDMADVLAAFGWKVVPDAIEREALAEGIAIGKQQERERIGAAAESEIRLVRGRPMVPMGTLDAILAEPSE